MNTIAVVLVVVIMILAFIIIMYYNKHLEARSKVSHIPGIHQFQPIILKIPFLTSHINLKSPIYLQIYDLIRKHGRNGVMSISTWKTSSVAIFSPENIKHVMVKYAKDYPKPQEQVYEAFDIFGPNILTTNGDIWRKHRMLSNPAFNDDHIKLVSKVTNQTMVSVTKEYWSHDSFDCNVVEDMTKITLQIMGIAGFGRDMKALNEDQTYDRSKYTMTFREAISRAADEIIIARFRYPKWLLNSPLPYFKNCREVVRNADLYLDDIISTCINDSDPLSKNYDLLSLLVAAKDEENKTGLSRAEIKSDSFIFLVAGHETTASQLMWSLWLLAKHQDVQEKVRKEVNKVFGDREELVHEDYDGLQYLLCVVKESMRLFPPINGVVKVATKNDVLSGYKINKGTIIRVNFYAMQRDPEIWDRPEEFIPERFESSNADHVDPMSYIPFSIGTRKCIGFQFSLTESVFILAHILRCFHIDLTEEQKKSNFVPTPRQFITIKPKELNLQFNRIKDRS
ncbi:cytochrome P450 [Acrasis kona]|uniref:Cytochrome P450 n=1 Tax=Acrasis kona TaxID=1008807 RepID=A0AAW2ZHB3_9EUKA